MRELDRIAVVGAGRMGTALSAAMRASGLPVDGPLRRGEAPDVAATLVLLTVPDGAIAKAAQAIPPGPVVGHCSGATTLEPLTAAGHRALSVHPLMTVPAGATTHFRGAGAAVAGSDPAALDAATRLAEAVGLHPVAVADADRAAYHAAASIASNFLVTVEATAERVAATTGVTRELLVPLVRATVDNWAALGPAALTGPIARGDLHTVDRHRKALRERAPEVLPLYDALAKATRPQDGPAGRRSPDGTSDGRPPQGVKTVRSVAEVREAVAAARARGGTVALVPTMGAFHEGHLTLMRAARDRADLVVVWLFVNPTQFNEAADLAAYPRDEARDAALAEAEGVDILFAAPPEVVYPPGFATTVTVRGLGDTLEGEHRPGHFDGVATVVVKMLNMVGPDVALFGAKDAQQVALVRRLVADLDIPVRIETIETVREPDGLALSSRNVHLSDGERRRALGLSRALAAAAQAAGAGERDPVRLRAAAEAVLHDHGVEPEYVAIVHPETFEPVDRINGRALVAVAARVGSTRLIDNRSITTQEA